MASENKERVGFLKKFREYWGIPRYRALIKLGLYFVFFGLIFLYIQVMSMFSRNNVSTEKDVDTLVKFKMMDNYEYSYVLETNILDKVYTVDVDGIRYDNTDTFEVSDYDFYVENNIIYSDNHNVDITNILPVDLLMFRPENLYSKLENNVEREIIGYQNGDEKVTYKIPVHHFNVGFLQGIDETNEVIEIITYESNGEIYKLELDIYNVMKLVNPEFESYTVLIEYSNINNIRGVEDK